MRLFAFGLAVLLSMHAGFASVSAQDEAFDPRPFLLREQDLPTGFAAIPDGERSDVADGVRARFRVFERDGGIVSSGAYAAPSVAVAETIFAQLRDDFSSVGAVWEPQGDLGDEGLSTSAFAVAEVIQRVAIFRLDRVTGIVLYTDRDDRASVQDAVQLARAMIASGQAAP